MFGRLHQSRRRSLPWKEEGPRRSPGASFVRSTRSRTCRSVGSWLLGYVLRVRSVVLRVTVEHHAGNVASMQLLAQSECGNAF